MVTVTGLPAVAVMVVGSNMKSLATTFTVEAPPPLDAAPVALAFLLPPPPPQPANTSPAVAMINAAVVHLRMPALRGSTAGGCQRTRKLDSPAGSSSDTSVRSTSARRGPARIQ